MSSTQDLGLVTAYGYAVEGGYTGTEAEFKTLLGQQQTYHDEAVQAAEDAEAYAAQAMSGTPDGYASLVSTVNSLNSALGNFGLKSFGNVSSNGSLTLEVPNYARALIYIASSTSEAGGLFIVSAASSGNVSVTEFQGTQNSITVDRTVANRLTFTLVRGGYPFALELSGTISAVT